MTSISKQPDNLITERMRFHALIRDDPMPYKVGINADIIEALPDIDVRLIGHLLGQVTRSAQYTYAMANASHRYGLSGSEHPLEDEHRDNAKKIIQDTRLAAKEKAKTARKPSSDTFCKDSHHQAQRTGSCGA